MEVRSLALRQYCLKTWRACALWVPCPSVDVWLHGGLLVNGTEVHSCFAAERRL